MFAGFKLDWRAGELPNANTIVIQQNDPPRAQNLLSKIRSVSQVVFIVQSLLELRSGSAVSCLLFDLT
jgi:hypothetical protein